MSSDTNEKPQSTFPRSSLRARNRTIVMAPADIEDFRPEPRKTKTPIRLEDIFGDSIPEGGTASSPAVDGTTAIGRILSGLSDATSVEENEGLAPDEQENQASPENGHVDLLRMRDEDQEQTSASVADADAQSDGAGDLEASVEPDTPSVTPVAKILMTRDEQVPKAWSRLSGESSSNAPHFKGDDLMLADDEDIELGQQREERLAELPSSVLTSASREHFEAQRVSKLVGFLVTYQLDRFGRYVELREGRLLVSSTGGAADNCLVIQDPSVSQMHAIMRISADGTILILDQLSEHGTKIKRRASGKEETLLGDKSNLEHGDVVIFGECAYHVCVLKDE